MENQRRINREVATESSLSENQGLPYEFHLTEWCGRQPPRDWIKAESWRGAARKLGTKFG